MPVQSTSGALSFIKIPLDTANFANNEYWLWKSNLQLAPGNSINLEGMVFESNICYLNGVANIANSGIKAFSLQLNQYYEYANVGWQKLQNSNAANFNVASNIFYSNAKLYNVYNNFGSNTANSNVSICSTNGSDIANYFNNNIGNGTSNSWSMKQGHAIVATSNDNYYVLGKYGQPRRNVLNKYSNTNTRLANKFFSSAGNTFSDISFFGVVRNTMIKSNDGNLILGIPYMSTTVPQSYNGIVGWNTTTDTINWQIYIPYPANVTGANTVLNQGITVTNNVDIAQDNTNNVYILHNYLKQSNTQQFTWTYLYKFDSTCSLLYWTKRFTNNTSQRSIAFNSLAIDNNNNPVISMNSYVVKLDQASGNKIFEKNTISGNILQMKINQQNNDLYLLQQDSVYKLPLDSTIAGYYTTTNDITITNNSTGVISTGIFTVSDYTESAYNSVVTSANTTISPYTVTQLS